MTRGPKNSGPAGHFVSGMEVSGIDPEIVREEQQAAERGVPDKNGAADLTALQQAVDIHKLQQGTGGVPRGYGQPEPQPLFATDPSQQDDVRHYGHHVHYPTAHQANAYMGGGAGAQLKAEHLSQGPGAGGVGGPSNGQILNSHALAERMAGAASGPGAGRIGKRRVRLGWTEDETRYLMEGCKRHGVGNWKKILTDPSFEFNCRTAVDLKDRFRTSFPDEYSRLYPNAKTHKVKRPSAGSEMSQLVKIKRKERRAFTQEEDERLLQGFNKHGPAWSKIQRDQSLNLGDRRSTDLRDRFRNAFPDRYTAAGYKGRTSEKASSVPPPPPDMGVPPSQMAQINVLDDDVHMQHQNMMSRGAGYIPMQHPHALQMPMGYPTQPVYFSPQMNLYRTNAQPPQQN